MIGSVFHHFPRLSEGNKSKVKANKSNQRIGLIKPKQGIVLIKSNQGIWIIKLNQIIG